MLHLNRIHLFNIHGAQTLSDLQNSLQLAIELEHSTIPPYLTAMYSFKPGENTEIGKIIMSVVAEEMLHMAIAANILNAIGGTPEFNKPDFIPSYPGHLPLGIAGGLIVGLEKFSKELVKEKFMMIEEPENPVEMPGGPEEVPDHQHTIGALYLSLRDKLLSLHRDKLPGDPAKQVTIGFSKDQLFPIITVDDAVRAIEVIIEQGEGTSKSPVDMEGDLAHYYKFEEIYYGKKIVPDKESHCGYDFAGETIPFNPDGVYPLFPNTKSEMLPEGSTERAMLSQFNQAYGQLLDELHDAFNGNPNRMSDTFTSMTTIAKLAQNICAMPFPGIPEYNLGLPFEYQPK